MYLPRKMWVTDSQKSSLIKLYFQGSDTDSEEQVSEMLQGLANSVDQLQNKYKESDGKLYQTRVKLDKQIAKNRKLSIANDALKQEVKSLKLQLDKSNMYKNRYFKRLKNLRNKKLSKLRYFLNEHCISFQAPIFKDLLTNCTADPTTRRYCEASYDMTKKLKKVSNAAYKLMRGFLPLPSNRKVLEKINSESGTD